MRNIILAGAMLAATAISMPGQTAVVVGTALTADGAVGVVSDTSNDGPAGTVTLLGQGFALAAGDYVLSGLTFWGNTWNLSADLQSFSVSFYAPSAVDHFTNSASTSITGPADTALATATFSVSPGGTGFVDSAGYDVLRYDWTPAAPFAIHSDGTLFISIAGDSGGLDDFFWMQLANDSYFQRDTGGPDGWADSAPDGTLAFRASFDGAGVGPVPEPASWAMMVFGFGVAGVAIRKRNRQVAVTA